MFCSLVLKLVKFGSPTFPPSADASTSCGTFFTHLHFSCLDSPRPATMSRAIGENGERMVCHHSIRLVSATGIDRAAERKFVCLRTF